MLHQLSGRQLSRNSSHRQALLRHETIRTAIPKAKELRRVVEPLITLGKEDSERNRRLAFSRLPDTEIVTKKGRTSERLRAGCAVSDDFARGRRRLRDYAGSPSGCASLLMESVSGYRSLMASATSKGGVGSLL